MYRRYLHAKQNTMVGVAMVHVAMVEVYNGLMLRWLIIAMVEVAAFEVDVTMVYVAMVEIAVVEDGMVDIAMVEPDPSVRKAMVDAKVGLSRSTTPHVQQCGSTALAPLMASSYLVSKPLAGPQGSQGALGDQIVEGPDDNVPVAAAPTLQGPGAAYLSWCRVAPGKETISRSTRKR